MRAELTRKALEWIRGNPTAEIISVSQQLQYPAVDLWLNASYPAAPQIKWHPVRLLVI